MTPQERAEKIVREINYGYGDPILRGNAPELVQWVCAQIIEAEDEKLEEAANTMWDCYNSGGNPSEAYDAIRGLKSKNESP